MRQSCYSILAPRSLQLTSDETLPTRHAAREAITRVWRGKPVGRSSVFRLRSLLAFLAGEKDFSENSSLEFLLEFVMEETVLSAFSMCEGTAESLARAKAKAKAEVAAW